MEALRPLRCVRTLNGNYTVTPKWGPWGHITPKSSSPVLLMINSRLCLCLTATVFHTKRANSGKIATFRRFSSLKIVSYCTLSISLQNVNQFSQFFTSRLCKKFATQLHAHHTYYVATLPCKTQISENQQYLQYLPLKAQW